MLFLLPILFISFASCKVYIHEQFDSDVDKRWINSDDKSVTHGVLSKVQKIHCSEGDFGGKLMNDSSYYHLSSKLSNPLNFKEKPMYFQYVFQYEQNIDCGGAYIKLFSELDQKKLTGESPYSIMVGADVCGYSTREIHVIISHKGTNYQLKEKQSFTLDTYPHLIELYIGKDKHFHIKFDGETKKQGLLEESYDYLPAQKIDDPSDKKPEDWVDESSLPDPADIKPEDWDDLKEIPDPDAQKPTDWDDESDGEWERDSIKNPNYKGEWTQKQIPNPEYKGPWSPKKIDNPAYKPDNTFADFVINYVGMDIWTVKSGTIFDEIFMSDDEKEANAHSKSVLASIKEQVEKIKKDEAEQAKNKEPSKDDIPYDKSDEAEVGDDEPISTETDNEARGEDL